MTMSRGRTITTKNPTRWRPLLAVAAVAALVAGMPPAGASAKKKPVKNVLTATINGRTIKFRRIVQIGAGGTTIAFYVIGQTRPHGILRTLGIGCADFPLTTVPGSSNFCTFNYQETKIGRHPPPRPGNFPLPPVAWTFQRTMGAWSVAAFLGADERERRTVRDRGRPVQRPYRSRQLARPRLPGRRAHGSRA
jgi:hypothetical protein